MFCSLFGLSPVDICLYKINVSSVKGLTGLLNNRFDMEKLENVKSEILYYQDLLSGGPIFDYVDREDRVAAKKINAGIMTAFGDDLYDVKERLSQAPKMFSGNFNSRDHGVISVNNVRAKEIIEALVKYLPQLKGLNSSVVVGEFHDERFFGKSLSELATYRNASALLYSVSDRLDNNDDIDRLWLDSISFSKYLEESSKDLESHLSLPTSGNLETFYSSFSGKSFNMRQSKIVSSVLEIVEGLNQVQLVPGQISALFNALVYCFIAEDDYDEDVSNALEKCGIFSYNPVKADIFLNMVSSVSFMSEGRAKINIDADDMGSFPHVLSIIKRVCENYITPVGPITEEVI